MTRTERRAAVEERWHRLAALRTEGMAYLAIARSWGLSYTTVRQLERKHEKARAAGECTICGPPETWRQPPLTDDLDLRDHRLTLRRYGLSTYAYNCLLRDYGRSSLPGLRTVGDVRRATDEDLRERGLGDISLADVRRIFGVDATLAQALQARLDAALANAQDAALLRRIATVQQACEQLARALRTQAGDEAVAAEWRRLDDAWASLHEGPDTPPTAAENRSTT